MLRRTATAVAIIIIFIAGFFIGGIFVFSQNENVEKFIEGECGEK